MRRDERPGYMLFGLPCVSMVGGLPVRHDEISSRSATSAPSTSGK